MDNSVNRVSNQLKKKYISCVNLWNPQDMCAEWLYDLNTLMLKSKGLKKRLCSNLFTQFWYMYHYPDYEIGENQYWTTGLCLNDYNSVTFCNLICDILDRRIESSPYSKMKWCILSDSQRLELEKAKIEKQIIESKASSMIIAQQTCDIREIIARLHKIVNHL